MGRSHEVVPMTRGGLRINRLACTAAGIVVAAFAAAIYSETQEDRDEYAKTKARVAQSYNADIRQGLIDENVKARGLIIDPVNNDYEFTRTVAERDEVCRGDFEVKNEVAEIVGRMACETVE